MNRDWCDLTQLRKFLLELKKDCGGGDVKVSLSLNKHGNLTADIRWVNDGLQYGVKNVFNEFMVRDADVAQGEVQMLCERVRSHRHE